MNPAVRYTSDPLVGVMCCAFPDGTVAWVGDNQAAHVAIAEWRKRHADLLSEYDKYDLMMGFVMVRMPESVARRMRLMANPEDL